MPSSNPEFQTQLDSAVKALLADNRDNEWFTRQYWPENQARVRRMIDDVRQFRPPAPGVRVLDAGCWSGYISFLLRRIGYQVTGADAWESAGRDALFQREGIDFFHANFNEAHPLSDAPEEAFDAVVFGEVIEHILNHPAGLVKALARTLRPGGMLVLTTPNPSTVMNAWRLVRGRSISWGTTEFMNMPKFENGGIISFEGIHYREYTTGELQRMLSEAGLKVTAVRYMGMGAGAGQPPLKRWLKENPLTRKLLSLRPFGATQYLLAKKTAPHG